MQHVFFLFFFYNSSPLKAGKVVIFYDIKSSELKKIICAQKAYPNPGSGADSDT